MPKNDLDLFDLFKISEWTRSLPQYGYVVSGFKRGQLGYLAEHHYLVTLFAWQICELIEQAGGKIDKLRVLELCLIHDFGELLGGDIAMPYARRNISAKKASREFEKENMMFLSQYFVDSKKIKELWSEATDAKTDEGYVAKLADLMETFSFKHYNDALDKIDWQIIKDRVPKIVRKFSDKKAKKALSDLLIKKIKSFPVKSARAIISG